MMGPGETCFCKLDEHTLLCAGGEGVLEKRLAQIQAGESPVWQAAWSQADGGLATVVAAEHKYESPSDVELPEEAQFTKNLFDQARTITVGLDWSPVDGQDVALRANLAFGSESQAQHWLSEARRLLKLYVAELQAGLEKAGQDAAGATAMRDVVSLLQNSRVDVRESENGWQVCVELLGPLETLPLVKASLKLDPH
jgi:hypothetical protein